MGYHTHKYFTIKLDLSGSAPNKLFQQQEKYEIYLSVNGLPTEKKPAHLDSKSLAEEFLDAYMPILKKRYTGEVKAVVDECSVDDRTEQTADTIKADSDLARRRLATGMFAANKKP